MNLDLDGLSAFIVFSDTLNFTRAAEILHISQPALHVKIRKLSSSLGVPLYIRTGKGLALTNYGNELARFARETQNQVNAFIEHLTKGKATQPVILAAGAGSFMYLLGDAIRKFKKKAEVPLHLITADNTTTLELLHIGKAHLGVTVLESIPDDFEAHLLAQIPAKLAVPITHPLAKKRSISIHDLDNAELILPPKGKPHRTTIERIFEIHNLSWKVAMEASGWELMMQFVKLGLGNAIVNGCCTVPNGVAALTIKEFPKTKYYLLTKRSRERNLSQQMLYDLIKENVSF